LGTDSPVGHIKGLGAEVKKPFIELQFAEGSIQNIEQQYEGVTLHIKSAVDVSMSPIVNKVIMDKFTAAEITAKLLHEMYEADREKRSLPADDLKTFMYNIAAENWSEVEFSIPDGSLDNWTVVRPFYYGEPVTGVTAITLVTHAFADYDTFKPNYLAWDEEINLGKGLYLQRNELVHLSGHVLWPQNYDNKHTVIEATFAASMFWVSKEDYAHISTRYDKETCDYLFRKFTVY
jgi:hypothetical protein